MKTIEKPPRCVEPYFLWKLLNYFQSVRDEWKHWAVLEARQIGLKHQKTPIGELRQLLEFVLQTVDVHVSVAEELGEILVIAKAPRHFMVAVIEAVLRQEPHNAAYKWAASDLADEGQNILVQCVRRWIGYEGHPSRVAALRFARSGNNFAVLDDDPMILLQLEKLLQAYGHVWPCSNEGQLQDIYLRYAPNMTFVDLHLAGASGLDVVASLRQDYDPDGQFVMMSADGVRERVVETLKRGLGRFLVKPLNSEHVSRQVLTCPLLVRR